MTLLTLFISLAWGQLSPHLFFHGWVSFLGFIYCFIILAQKRKQVGAVLGVAFTRATRVALCTVLLTAGFYLFYCHLKMGQTTLEVLAYLISATVKLGLVLPGAGRALEKVMGDVDDV